MNCCYQMAKYCPGKVHWREEHSSSAAADFSDDNVREVWGRGGWEGGGGVSGTRHGAYQPTIFWDLI